jgi:two-component system invasion response regulator UvrY
MKKILIVEDHAIVRMGIDILITDLFQSVDVYQAANFIAALDLIQAHVFDLIVLDINIPGGENSRMIGKIKLVQPSARILIFSGLEEEIYALHYIHYGANGFLSKEASEEECKVAILAVINSGKYVGNKVQQQTMKNILDNKCTSPNPLEDLSRRELEVMHMLTEGKWTKEIATALNLKETTISTYKARIFEKLEVGNIIEMFKKLEMYKDRSLDMS